MCIWIKSLIKILNCSEHWQNWNKSSKKAFTTSDVIKLTSPTEPRQTSSSHSVTKNRTAVFFSLHYLYIQLWGGGWEWNEWIKMRISIHIIITNVFPSFQTPTTSFRMLLFYLLSVKGHKIPMILFFTLQMAVQNPLRVWVEIAFIIAFWLNSDFMFPWYPCLFSSLLWKSNWSVWSVKDQSLH